MMGPGMMGPGGSGMMGPGGPGMMGPGGMGGMGGMGQQAMQEKVTISDRPFREAIRIVCGLLGYQGERHVGGYVVWPRDGRKPDREPESDGCIRSEPHTVLTYVDPASGCPAINVDAWEYDEYTLLTGAVAPQPRFFVEHVLVDFASTEQIEGPWVYDRCLYG